MQLPWGRQRPGGARGLRLFTSWTAQLVASDHPDSVYNTAWISLESCNFYISASKPSRAPARNAKKPGISASATSSSTDAWPPAQRRVLRKAWYRLCFLICNEDDKDNDRLVYAGIKSACAYDGGQRPGVTIVEAR